MRLGFGSASLFMVFGMLCVAANGIAPDRAAVLRGAVASTVRIETEDGNGTGVVVGRYGKRAFILTAYHVVEDGQDIKVRPFDSGFAVPAAIDSADDAEDLALIYTLADFDAPPIRVASADVQRFEPVYILGQPFERPMASEGIVVRVGTYNWRVTGGFVAPGASGGPMLNTRGELVCITLRVYQDSDGEIYPGLAEGAAREQVAAFVKPYVTP